jgi:hypothetical protein
LELPSVALVLAHRWVGKIASLSHGGSICGGGHGRSS